VKKESFTGVISGTLNRNTQVSFNPGERTAIQKLVDSQPLTPDDRSAIANLLFSGRPGLSDDELRALSYGLVEDQARDRPASAAAAVSKSTAESAAPPPGAVRQNRRFLRVLNNSTEPVKLWLQYNLPVERGSVWVPADPEESSKALAFDLAPGRAYDLHHNGERIAANRVRFWALSPTRTWSRSADADLVLTAAGDEPDGYYLDTKVQTYTLKLSP
jgi:hypothetical protein